MFTDLVYSLGCMLDCAEIMRAFQSFVYAMAGFEK